MVIIKMGLDMQALNSKNYLEEKTKGNDKKSKLFIMDVFRPIFKIFLNVPKPPLKLL